MNRALAYPDCLATHRQRSVHKRPFPPLTAAPSGHPSAPTLYGC